MDVIVSILRFPKFLLLDSGHQMRQDDPLALKDIIQLVQDKMQGKNPNQLRYLFSVIRAERGLITEST